MWACLQDQDTAGQWKQVAGWRKVCDLALTHLGRLREYRRGLAEAWPPETNAAAQAYVGELDQLIDRVQRTHDAAAANYDALAAAARAIGSARSELQPLYDEFATKLRQKQAYEATIADPKAVAGSRLPERPPVTDDDLEQLNVRARGLMTGLSGELQLAQVMLQRPPAPARPGRQVNDPDAYEQAVPTIPPVVPLPTPYSARDAYRSESRTATTEVRSPAHGLGIGGPILGGTGPGTAQVPLTSNPPASTTPSAAPIIGTQTNAPPITGIERMLPDRPGMRPPPASALNNSSTGHSASTNAPRSSPSNGFIGAPPGGITNQPNPSAPRRVNPVGGVIGGGGAGTAPSGSAGSRPGAGRFIQPTGNYSPFPAGGSPSAMPNLGSRRPPRSHIDEQSSWDPDHPWQTSQGVDPVMLPPEDEGPIDPGPAIGFNR